MRTPLLHWLKTTLQEAAWAPGIVFIFYAIAAKGFDAYLFYPWLDKPTHFCGGAAITYFYAVGIRRARDFGASIPPLVQALLAVGLTAVTAIIWEFLEFGADYFLGTHLNLGVADTLADLFFGLAGGVVVALAMRLKQRT